MDISKLTDDELAEQIQETFEEDGRLVMDYIDITAQDSIVNISGRVSSEEELQIIEELLNETVGVEAYKNKVWVDESLVYDDDDDEVDVRGMNFDDDGDLDDQDYSGNEDEDQED